MSQRRPKVIVRLTGCLLLLLPLLAIGIGMASAAQVKTWEDLNPAVGAPIRLPSNAERKGQVPRAIFEGNDEDFELFLEDLEFMRSAQPTGGFLNTELKNKTIKIAGYVTPVGFEDETVREFLFVPYLGACVHVPAPEANQIIYVTRAEGLTADMVWSPVWLTGSLEVNPIATVLADVGYRMTGASVTPYTGTGDSLQGEKSVGHD